MPFITLQNFEPLSEKNNDGNSVAKIGVRVSFSVPQIDNKQRAVEVLIYAAG